MNIETRLVAGLEVSQQLGLAPQLLQWLKLLQIPTPELCALVRKELETNPALEMENPAATEDSTPSEQSESAPEETAGDLIAEPTRFDESDMGRKFELLAEADSEWANDSGVPLRDYSQASDSDANERRQYALESIVAPASLQEHLLSQLALARLSPVERHVAELIIGSLDKRGYLTATLDELAALAKTDAAVAEKALAAVQSFDPAGVAARDLPECLLLQLDDKSGLAAAIVTRYLEPLARRQYREIASFLKVDEQDVIEARETIMRLNPEPGSAFGQEHARYVTPDVTVVKDESGLTVQVNDDYVPRLRISASCRRMIEAGSLSAEDMAYLRRKIRNASFLIQGIGQRQQTMRKVAEEIVKHQRDYFESERGELKPLTMARIAEAIGVHETTVSRTISGKHMLTPRGIYEMKYFFRAGYQRDDGSAVIPDAVQELIASAIENEDPANPLTDLQIARLLKDKGLHLARRTIAKYREELCIPSSKERARTRRPKRLLSIKEAEADRQPLGMGQAAQVVG